GPLTATSWPSTLTSTPLGTEIGFLPIRDMVFSPSLPDVGEDFPTHTLLRGLTVGQEAWRGRQDGDAESAEHLRQVRGLRVHPQSRFRHPAQAGDRTFPIGSELEVQEQRLADLGVLDAPVGDVALGLEDLGDVRLELRERHADVLVVSRVGVAQTREHVCDWISHCHLGTCPSSLRFPPTWSAWTCNVEIILS